MCQSIPYVVTEEGNIKHFTGDKMENIYDADDRYSNFLQEQVKELEAEKSQSFLGIMFRVLTGRGWGIGNWLEFHPCQSPQIQPLLWIWR